MTGSYLDIPTLGSLTTGVGLMLSFDTTVLGWLTDFESPEAPSGPLSLYSNKERWREKEGQARSMGLTNKDTATRISCIAQGTIFNIF